MIEERCHAKVGPNGTEPEISWLSRRRPDGSRYSIRIERGERCPNRAVFVRHVDGHPVRRCMSHSFTSAEVVAA